MQLSAAAGRSGWFLKLIDTFGDWWFVPLILGFLVLVWINSIIDKRAERKKRR